MVLAPRPGVGGLGHPLIQTVLRFTAEDSPFEGEMQLQPGCILQFPWMTVPMVSLMCCIGKPGGVGSIEFESADPRCKPKVRYEFLDHPLDRSRAVEAMELGWLLARRGPLSELADFFWPSERVLSDRKRIAEWINSACGSGYHPAGTVPMGTGSDGAVDERGHVRGVTGLRVADASIMPTLPSSNTNLATIMIGERFGEWLANGE